MLLGVKLLLLFSYYYITLKLKLQLININLTRAQTFITKNNIQLIFLNLVLCYYLSDIRSCNEIYIL